MEIHEILRNTRTSRNSDFNQGRDSEGVHSPNNNTINSLNKSKDPKKFIEVSKFKSSSSKLEKENESIKSFLIQKIQNNNKEVCKDIKKGNSINSARMKRMKTQTPEKGSSKNVLRKMKSSSDSSLSKRKLEEISNKKKTRNLYANSSSNKDLQRLIDEELNQKEEFEVEISLTKSPLCVSKFKKLSTQNICRIGTMVNRQTNSDNFKNNNNELNPFNGKIINSIELINQLYNQVATDRKEEKVKTPLSMFRALIKTPKNMNSPAEDKRNASVDKRDSMIINSDKDRKSKLKENEEKGSSNTSNGINSKIIIVDAIENEQNCEINYEADIIDSKSNIIEKEDHNESAVSITDSHVHIVKKKKGRLSERQLERLKCVSDSLSEEELVLLSDNKSFAIDPNSILKSYWNTFCYILLLYSIVITPLTLSFTYHETFYYYFVEISIDFIFIIDIILAFFTAFYIGDKLITDLRTISLSYLSSSLFFDLISLIPSLILLSLPYDRELKVMQSSTVGTYNFVKWVRVLRITKLSRIGLDHMVRSFGKFGRSLSFKLMVSFFILIHFSSCIWCFIGNAYKYMNYDVTWINRNNLTEKGNEEIMIAAVYFILTTMFTIGYGDIIASNFTERIFILFLLVLGSLTWSFVLTSLSHFFSQKVEKQVELEKRTKILEEIKYEHNLPNKIFERFQKYIAYEVNKYNKHQLILIDSLPSNLRNSLYLSMYGKHISYLQFFKNQSYDFIITVLPSLKYACYLKDEYITNIGNVIEGVYMVYNGILGIYLSSLYDNLEIWNIFPSCHIGDILMYSDDQCPYDIKVKTKKADLLILMKSDFANLYLSFTEAIETILKRSTEIYSKMEKKKNVAMEYKKTNGTLMGFVFNIRHYELFDDESFCVDHKENNDIDNSSDKIEVEKLKKDLKYVHKEENLMMRPTTEDFVIKSQALSTHNILSQSYLKNLAIINEEPQQVYMKTYDSHDQVDSERFKMIAKLNTVEAIPNKAPKPKATSKFTPKPITVKEYHSDHSTNNIMNNTAGHYVPKNNIMRSKIQKYTMGRRAQVFVPAPGGKPNEINESFLNILNSKIENHAIMNKNKEIMGEYLKDVLIMEKDVFQDEDNKFRSMMGKLDRLESSFKLAVSKKNSCNKNKL